MAVYTLEFTMRTKIDFNIVVFTQQLANQLKEAEEGLMVGVLFHVDIFCHNREIRFDERTHLNLSLGFELSHLRIVVETMHVHEVVV